MRTCTGRGGRSGLVRAFLAVARLRRRNLQPHNRVEPDPGTGKPDSETVRLRSSRLRRQNSLRIHGRERPRRADASRPRALLRYSVSVLELAPRPNGREAW